MNILVIYAHPKTSSFNHSIKEAVVAQLQGKGHDVKIRDLYALGFDPVLSAADLDAIAAGATPADIAAEQELITAADGLVFVYPTWWANMPAIMRGYIDRVFAYNFAYYYTETGSVPMLTGKKAFAVQTTDSAIETLDRAGLTLAMKTSMSAGILGFVGLEHAGHMILPAVNAMDNATRQQMIAEVVQAVDAAF